jgi:hypothetical protein
MKGVWGSVAADRGTGTIRVGLMARALSAQPQPLRRQRAQLMMIPTSSHGTYPETEPRFVGGTDGDSDSEMGG